MDTGSILRSSFPETTQIAVGTSASPDGAGLAAVNSAGGADLVLDGSEDAATDTAISEAGISRSSSFAETFSISNPGAGGITLDINGDLEVVGVSASGTYSGDGSGLTGVVVTESDPIYAGDPAAGITGTNISNWDTAFGWGNHSTQGYLTIYTETDPVYSADPAFGITGTSIANWNTAYGWGDHSTQGYLTSYTETDPVYSADPAAGITGINISNWNTAHGWGNHAAFGYDTTNDAWTGTASAVWTQWMVGIGISTAPAYRLHVFDNSPPGVPHLYMEQAGPGDVFVANTLSMAGISFSDGIDAADNSFKITTCRF